MVARRFLPLVGSLAVLIAGCSTPDPPRQSRGKDVLRVATYNLQWFSEDANPARIANVKAVLRAMDADVVGFEEIQSVKALRQVLGDEWDVSMTDDPDDQQETAIAVRRPFLLAGSEPVFPSASLDEYFPGARDALRCVVQTPYGEAVTVYVVHMKSRRGGRLSTDPARITACGLLAAYLKSKPEEDAVVIGDFNDGPDDRSVNVLETGDIMAEPGAVRRSPRLLENVTEPLARRDYVTIEAQELQGAGHGDPVVKGAWAENARLRGMDYEFPRDVRITQAFFDQILMTPDLATSVLKVQVFWSPEAVTGDKGRTIVGSEGVTYAEKGDLASDHLPVYADVRVRSAR